MVPGFLYTDDCLNNVHLVGQTHPPILVVSDDPEITDSGNFLAAISPPKSYLYVDEYMPAMLAPDLDQSGPQYGRRLKGIVAGDPLPANEAASVNWQTDYTSAADQAKKNNKPLLVEFGASWCGPCRRMERTTYVDAAVAAKLNNDFVAVKLDSASRDARMLRVKYPFRGIPTVLVFDRGGKLKQTLTGFMGPYQFLNKLSERQ
jgi:thioredoxin 1